MPATSPEQIQSLLQTAFNQADLDLFVALHEDTATMLVPPDARRATGKAAIREAAAAVFSLRPSADFRLLGKLEDDGLALTYGEWTLVGTGPDGGRVELTGRGTRVSRRQSDGRWLIVLDDPMSGG